MQRRGLLGLVAVGLADGIGRLGENGPLRGSDEAADATGSDRFEPAVHGFGFSNWVGAEGESRAGRSFTLEPGDVTQETVHSAIEDAWVADLSDAATHLMTRIVYSWIGNHAATNGHCYGMIFTADEYYHDPAELPEGVDAASEIPHPTDEYQAVGNKIRRIQTSQLLRAETYWYGLLGLRWGMADHGESLEMVADAIDETGTGGLLLNGDADAHQVLAHDSERDGDRTIVSVYDPNYTAAEHEDQDEIWTLVVDSETGEVHEIDTGYDEFLYHDPGMDRSVLDSLIGGHERVIDALSNAIFLGLATGGTLEVNAPGDAIVDRPDAEYADPDRGPYTDAVIVLGALDEVEVSIRGEVGNEYSLEAVGVRDDTLAMEEAVSGTLDAVALQLRLSADEAGNLALDVIEEVDEETPPDAEGDNDLLTRPADAIEDFWWVPATGGALGLGVGYWLYADRSDDEAGDR